MGRPTTATWTGSSPPTGAGRSPSSSTTRSSRSPLPSPCVAETGIGSPRPSFGTRRRCARPGPVGFVDDDEDRRLAAAQRLRQLRVAGSHARPAVDDEQDRVGLGHPDPGLALDVGRQLALVGEVDAAGVEQLEGDAVPLQGTRLRSRVTPGSAWVTASRPPASRLTSVLLPTLGKPTTATVGRLSRSSTIPRSRARETISSTTSCTDLPVVSTTTASSAFRRALILRSSSSLSRSSSAVRTAETSSPVSIARRRARSSGEAVRYTFSGAWGRPRFRCHDPQRRSRDRQIEPSAG